MQTNSISFPLLVFLAVSDTVKIAVQVYKVLVKYEENNNKAIVTTSVLESPIQPAQLDFT